ncbi:MAG: hypothetical protein ACI9MR_000017 [Myxococcota bacterium]|jgi:hypothetical protein
MAHDLTALNVTVEKRVEELAEAYLPAYDQFTETLILDNSTTTANFPAVFGNRSFSLANASGTPEADNMIALASSATPVSYHKLRTFTFDELDKDPTLVSDSAADFFTGYTEDIEDAWFEQLSLAATTAHPYATSDYLQSGAKFADSNTITTEAGATHVVNNVFALAPASSALTTMHAARSRMRDFGGNLIKMPREKGMVWCVPELTDDINGLLGRQGEILKSDDSLLQGGYGRRLTGPYEIVTPTVTSTDIWGIIWPTVKNLGGRSARFCPIVPVVKNNLIIRVTEGVTANTVNVIASGSWTIALFDSSNYQLSVAP